MREIHYPKKPMFEKQAHTKSNTSPLSEKHFNEKCLKIKARGLPLFSKLMTERFKLSGKSDISNNFNSVSLCLYERNFIKTLDLC